MTGRAINKAIDGYAFETFSFTTNIIEMMRWAVQGFFSNRRLFPDLSLTSIQYWKVALLGLNRVGASFHDHRYSSVKEIYLEFQVDSLEGK